MIHSAVVLGAGTMGSGIAQWLAQAGVKVELADANLSVATEAHKRILLSWKALLEKGKFTPEQVKTFEDNLFPIETSDCKKDSDLLIEAIIENLDVKKQVFHELDLLMHEKTIFASNTSSFQITTLASRLPLKRQKRFLGLHFFNPATLMKLVEVVRARETEESLAKNLAAWFKSQGKVPALCQDSPGFIVNRLARNFYGESLRLAGMSADENRLKEIDTIMREVGGFKMGPFELMDLIGLDINYQVSTSVWEAFHREPRFQPHRLQASLVDAGLLGRKTKQGFYRYE